MPRFFTLAEAERAVARLEPELRRAMSLRVSMRQAQEELQGIARKVILSGGLVVDRVKVAAIKRTRDEIAGRLQKVVESIQESGCLVKDVDIGLLDFPTLYRGREVYLCWRQGEESIAWWHGVEEGFPGRKPIDEEFVENHRGD